MLRRRFFAMAAEIVPPLKPIIKLDPSSINHGYAADFGESNYTITNGTPGNNISYRSNASWINEVMTLGGNRISYDIDENTSTRSRQSSITISYPNADDVDLFISQSGRPTPPVGPTRYILLTLGAGGINDTKILNSTGKIKSIWIQSNAAYPDISQAEKLPSVVSSVKLSSLSAGNHNYAWMEIAQNSIWYAFKGITSIIEADMTHANVEDITDMDGMFDGCSNMEKITGMSGNWSSCTYTRNMFRNCSKLKAANCDFEGMIMNGIPRSAGMFSGCTNLGNINLVGWNFSTTRSGAEITNMFSYCKTTHRVDVSGNYNTGITRTTGSVFSNTTSSPSGTNYVVVHNTNNISGWEGWLKNPSTEPGWSVKIG